MSSFFDDDLSVPESLEPGDLGAAFTCPPRLRDGFVGPAARGGPLPGNGVQVEVVVEGETFGLVAVAAPEGTEDTLDAALARGLSLGGAIIAGDALGSGPFAVYDWPGGDVGAPAVVSVQATASVCALVLGGEVYCPANPLAPTERYVMVPDLESYYALAADTRDELRGPWATTWDGFDGRPAGAPGAAKLSVATLRLLIASHPECVPIYSVTRSGSDRGGVCKGLTRPFLTADMNEPRAYLAVISRKEGPVDAINGWDVNAGVSLGSVQFNVIRGHLFHLLGEVWRADRALFAACFGDLKWTMDVSGRFPTLVVGRDGTPWRLSWSPPSTPDDERAMQAEHAGYFQSGVPGKSGTGDIKPDWRRELCARFRNLVLWPHVQQWVQAESARYLASGFKRIESHPVQTPVITDAYALRAALMSAYVRFSGSLRYLLDGLGDSHDAKAALPRLPKALDALAKQSSAWKERADALRPRLDAQVKDAKRLFDARPQRVGSRGVIAADAFGALAMLWRGSAERAAIRALQAALELDDDGDFGRGTEAAVREWQRAQGDPVTGLVSVAMLRALGIRCTYVERRVRVDDFGTLDADDPVLVEVPSTTASAQRLHAVTAEAFASLAAAAKADLGLDLAIASGYRPHRWRSRAHYEEALIKEYGSVAVGRKYRAYASPHETGLALDFGVGGLEPKRATIDAQQKTPLWKWLVEHAFEHGFSPYKREPWHWELAISRDAWETGEVPPGDAGWRPVSARGLDEDDDFIEADFEGFP